MSAPNLNNDVLLKVLEFMDPNPFVFQKLARVSRLFREVFTSDSAWRYLDPYGVNTDIYSKFTAIRKGKELDEIYKCWFDTGSREPSENLYGTLGSLVNPRSYSVMGAPPNRQLFWCAVNIKGTALRSVPWSLDLDRELCIAALRNKPESFENVREFKADKEIVMFTLQLFKEKDVDDLFYDTLTEEIDGGLLYDIDVAKALVRLSAYFLEDLPYEVQCEHEILLEVANTDSSVLQGAAQLDDREIVLAALETDYTTLNSAYAFQDDNEVVNYAVSLRGEALAFASPRLRDYEPIVFQALKRNGNALVYASRRLQDTEDIVEAAIAADPEALYYASTRLQKVYQDKLRTWE